MLLEMTGDMFFSILLATRTGVADVKATRDAVLNNPAKAAIIASERCGIKIGRVTWIESIENDARWIQAANIYAHKTKNAAQIRNAPLN